MKWQSAEVVFWTVPFQPTDGTERLPREVVNFPLLEIFEQMLAGPTC